MMRRFARGLFALPLLLLLACGTQPAAVHGGAVEAASQAVARLETAPSAQTKGSKPAEGAKPVMSRAAFGALVDRLSEPDGNFFSDNYVSNETSYLQVADELVHRAPKGGVYLGVGPEQNFSYLELTKPDLAFIIDIRRDNMLEHLIYKAAFELAGDRAAFLALLTGRTAPKGLADADLEHIVDAVAAADESEASFRAAHQALLDRIAEFGVELDGKDRRAIDRIHRAFYDGGVDLRFSLKQKSFRKYPSLRELVLARSPKGRALGFLASPARFAFVKQMEEQNRIVPLVGNFAGDRTLPELAKLLTSEHRVVRWFYVSNVEQYLMADGVWWKWKRNVAALPSDDQSLFIRCYLDQGKRHPRQMKGQRTTTVLQRIADFDARDRPYRSMLDLATDKLVATR